MSLHAAAYAEPPHPGDEQADRARAHREQALQALDDGDRARAVAHAVLCVAERIDELAVWVARLT